MMLGTKGQRSGKASGNRKDKDKDKDIISTMPDEILTNIVSRLTIEEAGRTSVLSTKWRYLWTLFFGLLNFDHSVKLFNLRRQRMPLLRKCNRFVSEWERFMSNVENVLKSLKSPSLHGLKVSFDMGNPKKVAELFKFAAEKDVQVLELDFSFHFHMVFFTISETIRNVLSNGFKMKSLKELRLVCVEVKGKVLEQFLALCPSLETLYVRDSRRLSRLRVCGEGLRLKHLALVECNLGYLFISAVNLVAFTYKGEYGDFVFDSVPNLVEATFGKRYASYVQLHMTDDIDVHRLLSQLNVLKLELFPFDLTFLVGLPVYNNVDHLELAIPQEYGKELDRPISLLSAFPSISVLKLKFLWYRIMPPSEEAWIATPEVVFPNLEVLEVSGCRRDPSQNEFIKSTIENAPNLRKIVVDPVSSIHEGRSDEFKAMVKALNRDFNLWFADSLKPDVPQHVELVVL